MRIAIQGVPSPEPVELPPQAQLIDTMTAPEIFATGVSGFSNVNGVIVVALESARCDHARTPATFERVVVGRIALTVPSAQALVASLNDFLEQQGMSPSRALMGQSTRQ